MNLNRKFLWPIIGALLICSTGFAGGKSVKLATGDYVPFTGERLLNGGPFTEIVKAAFEASGYTVEITYLPWEGALEQTKLSVYDATFPYAESEKNRRVFNFSGPFFKAERKIYSRNGTNFHLDHIETFTGSKLCRPSGYTIQQEFTDAVSKNEIPVVNNDDLEGCFEMLASGQADFIPLATVVADSLVRGKKFAGKIQVSKDSFGASLNFLLISKGNPRRKKLTQDFESGLSKIGKNGTIDQILQKHFQY